MTAAALVEWLHTAGCELALAGDGVKVRGPRQALTPEMLCELRARKGELLEALRTAELAHFEPLREVGDLVGQIDLHLRSCRTCQREHFVTDETTPCCRTGADLKWRYRRVRKAALAGDLRG